MFEHTVIKGPHQAQKTYTMGAPLAEAEAAMILIHGRGASAASILELAGELHHADMAYLAQMAKMRMNFVGIHCYPENLP